MNKLTFLQPNKKKKSWSYNLSSLMTQMSKYELEASHLFSLKWVKIVKVVSAIASNCCNRLEKRMVIYLFKGGNKLM